MAVKQNNTEANGTPTSVGNDGNNGSAATAANAVSNGSKMSSVSTVAGSGVILGGGVIAKSQKMSASVESVTGSIDPAGCTIDSTGSNKVTLKSLKVKEKVGVGKESSGNASNNKGSDIACILRIIDLVESKRKQMSQNDLGHIYQHLILELARVQLPRQTEEMKRFKEDIAKVGAFFGNTTDQNHYLFYLRVVCQLVTRADDEPPPSCAIAIIFQLFSADMVIDAVQSLLEMKIPDQNLKQTVRLLCDWLRMCNFCHNLNFWIIAILGGLQMQLKFALIDDIAMENIELLFMSLIIPVLRPKSAPIVLRMLSTTQRPQVFHKVRH